MTDLQEQNSSASSLSSIARQCTEDSHDWFGLVGQQKPADWQPVDGEIDHHIKSLGGEIGEVLNKWKKYERGSVSREEIMAQLPDELADIFTYLMNLPELVGFDMEEEYYAKRTFNWKRFGKDSTAREEGVPLADNPSSDSVQHRGASR